MAFSNLKLNSSVVSDKLNIVMAGMVFVVVVALGGWFLIKPELDKFAPDSELNATTQQMILTQRKNYLADLKILADLAEGKGVTSGVPLSAIVPDNTDLPTLFASYEALARNHGMQVASVDMALPSEKGKTSGTTVNASIKVSQTRYTTFKSFLRDLEALDRLADVKSFGYDGKSGFANISIAHYFEP